MRYLEKLLDGVEVEWKSLADISDIFGGLTGKSKSDFENGNAKYVPYKNIFNNPEVNFKQLEFVKVAENERQYEIKYGDILFTGSSEIADEIGMSSAVTTNPDSEVYLNSFSFGLRFNSDVEIIPQFSKHLFRSHYMRRAIAKTASGVTRYNISKRAFGKIQIPVPPREVQNEIVRILDTLTELTTKLTIELTARKQQYSYYREQLLTFNKDKVEWKSLIEIGEVRRGTAITEKEANPGNYPVVANGPSYNYYHDQSNRSGEIIVIARSGAYAGLVSYWDIPIFLTDAFSIHPDKKVLITKFLYYILKKDQTKIHNMAKGAGVPHVRVKDFEPYKVPVPSLEEQERIVSILDKFDTLTNSDSEGLPKEIELRKKQYQYYRDRLLTFPNDI
ncbi:restriction endonuclease subunit S [Hufsiella ginkgonis]|uniref:Restriction endonuclease subunit S n=1 Tax=Hufsiella ginkgonis TaxID=2695274 RepID=A0A7K1XU68_9SPHI|nr:restriction endonuclease subunit S [Hufsiella ginkgonis]MXV14309.1 restriction endonuclease subunit S [Hufsiella ginkgonis]